MIKGLINRKYICHYHVERTGEWLADFISELGQEPEKYELINVFSPCDDEFAVIYKEYINEDTF